MFTHAYKSGFIHGYCDRPECRAQIGFVLIWCDSYRAAQLAITRHILEQR